MGYRTYIKLCGLLFTVIILKRTNSTIISDSINTFTFDLFKNATPSDDSSGNKFISPYSVFAALMLTMLGSKADTTSQIADALNVDVIETMDIHQTFSDKQNNITKSVTDVELSIANSLFCKIGISLLSKYVSDAQKYYESELTFLDFDNDPEGSRQHINQWVEQKTKGLIKEILKQGAIKQTSIMFLVNAIYFKGSWLYKFDSNKTEEKDFHVSDTKIAQVNMMKMRTNQVKSFADVSLDAKVLELPYTGTRVSLVIILPNKRNGISELEKNLTPTKYKSLMSKLKLKELDIEIPKFEMLSSFQLIPQLRNLGIQDLFIAGKANLSNMFENPPDDIHVSGVDHKAFVRVNEEGTEAAAVTSISFRTTSIQPDDKKFIADHPFLFAIREMDTGTILFIGRFNQPV